jgi:hypothetical protein
VVEGVSCYEDQTEVTRCVKHFEKGSLKYKKALNVSHVQAQ